MLPGYCKYQLIRSFRFHYFNRSMATAREQYKIKMTNNEGFCMTIIYLINKFNSKHYLIFKR